LLVEQESFLFWAPQRSRPFAVASSSGTRRPCPRAVAPAWRTSLVQHRMARLADRAIDRVTQQFSGFARSTARTLVNPPTTAVLADRKVLAFLDTRGSHSAERRAEPREVAVLSGTIPGREDLPLRPHQHRWPRPRGGYSEQDGAIAGRGRRLASTFLTFRRSLTAGRDSMHSTQRWTRVLSSGPSWGGPRSRRLDERRRSSSV
jgi:hypothetical protein